MPNYFLVPDQATQNFNTQQVLTQNLNLAKFEL